MKKTCVIFLIFILIFYCFSFLFVVKAEEESGIEWSRIFGGTDNEEGYYVQQTSDGGFILVGETHSYSSGEDDVWLIKTDANGHELWNRTFGGESYDAGYSVQQTSDGGYIVAGGTFSYASGEQDIWLIKTGADGKEEWNTTFGSIYTNEWGEFVHQTNDGGYIIVGSGHDVWFIKTDENGNETWNRTFGGNEWDFGNSVQKTSDGGYIIVGATQSYGAGSDDVWLIKTDSNGDEQWNKTFGGTDTDGGYSIQQTVDGGYIISGRTFSYSGNDYSDVWLIKTGNSGNEQWSQTFGGTKTDEGYSIQQTNDGGYIITGETQSYGEGGLDLWLIKTDSGGNEQWNKTFGGQNNDRGNSVQQTADGNYIIVGYSNNDIWLIKAIEPDEIEDDGQPSNGAPGFELILVLIAITLFLFWKRSRM